MKKIILILLIWRIGLFGVAGVAPEIIKVYGEKFPFIYILTEESRPVPNWMWVFGGFDGVYYLRIARNGYAYKSTQAFFPFYPILIRTLSDHTSKNLLLSALEISNFCFFASVILFHSLIKKKFDEKTAFWSSLFLIFFPTSFYFGSVYTESLFFLLLIGSFYLYESKKYFFASVLGAFSSFTRLIGIFLSVALLKLDKKTNFYSIFIVPIGLIIYMIYLKVVFNNPFYFMTAQTVFGQGRSATHFVLLPQVYYRSIAQVLTTHGLVLYNSTLDFTAATICIILLYYAYKIVPKNWTIFSALAILTPPLTGSFISMPRYILIAFPMYIVLGKIKNSWIKIFLLALSISLLIVNTLLFTRGYWVA